MRIWIGPAPRWWPDNIEIAVAPMARQCEVHEACKQALSMIRFPTLCRSSISWRNFVVCLNKNGEWKIFRETMSHDNGIIGKEGSCMGGCREWGNVMRWWNRQQEGILLERMSELEIEKEGY